MPVEVFDPNKTTGGAEHDVIVLPDPGPGHATPDDDNHWAAVRAHAASVYQVALPIIFGLIIVTGIIGNVMVIIVISTRRKLRTVTNVLLMNLAVADVAFLGICGPFTMAHYVLTDWLLGDAICRMVQYFLYLTCYVTVYTLVAVAVVRYLLMVRLSTHPFVKSTRHIGFVILAIWIGSVLVNIPVPLAHGETTNTFSNHTECVISCQTTSKYFFSFFFVFAYGLPLTVIAVLYILLVVHLRKNSRDSMVGKQDKSRRVTRLLILVVATFALCWLPLQVHLMWGTFGHLPTELAYRMVLIVWHALVFLNSALNPVIYHCFCAEFRENFKALCGCGEAGEGSLASGSGGSKGPLLKTSG